MVNPRPDVARKGCCCKPDLATRPAGASNHHMPKNLRSFLDDMRRMHPNEVVTISKTVNPLTYDVTAIVKQLGALKRFPVLLFEQPLNAHGQLSGIRLVIGKIGRASCRERV